MDQLLSWLLPVLKAASIAITGFLGIYGVLHDFKSCGKVTKAGRRAISVMSVAVVVGLVAVLVEQVMSERTARTVEKQADSRAFQSISAGAYGDPAFIRFQEYFRVWQVLLERSFPSPVQPVNPEVDNASVLHSVPAEFRTKMLGSVNSVNQLIHLAESTENPVLLMVLLQHSRFVERTAFTDSRLLSVQSAKYVRSLFGAASRSDASSKARRSIDEMLRLYGSSRQDFENRCFVIGRFGGVRRSDWDIVTHDLSKIVDLQISLTMSDYDANVETISFPWDGFPASECD